MTDFIESLPPQVRFDLKGALEGAARQAAVTMGAPPPDEHTPLTARAAMQARYQLASMRALEMLRRQAVADINAAAHQAATPRSVDGPRVSYADLGEAVGISRQGARERWRGILSAPEAETTSAHTGPGLTPVQAMERPEQDVASPRQGDQVWITWAATSPDPADVATWTWRRAEAGRQVGLDPARWEVTVDGEVTTERTAREIYVVTP